MKVEIEVPEGHEIDNVTFKKIEKKLPESWEELKRISGWYVDANSDISFDCLNANSNHFNIFATKEQAEASIALAQLSQLMQVYNDGWVADWTDEEQMKFTVCFFNESIKIYSIYSHRCFLTFKKESIAKLFAERFKDLIQQAKPLL